MTVPILHLEIEEPGNLVSGHRYLPRAAELFVSRLALLLQKHAARVAPRGERHVHPLTHYPDRKGPRVGLAETIKVITPLSQLRGMGMYASALVGASASYAGYVARGTTRIYPIAPRRVKTLTIWDPEAFDADEYGFVHRRSVLYQGRAPIPYMRQGWEGIPAVERAAAWEDSLRKAGFFDDPRRARKGDAVIK